MSNIIVEAWTNKLKNQFYGLLCEYEKQGEWSKYLDTLKIELLGVPEDQRSINWYRIMAKAGALPLLNYENFRRTVFEIMALLSNANLGV